MRKQYHHCKVGPDTHVWDVHKLIRASKHLPVVEVPLEDIAEIDENWWYQQPGTVPTPRSMAQHMELVEQTDLSHPVILSAEGRLMDGMHRVVRALVEKRTHIRAVRFDKTPPPDFKNVSLDDLPYPDEDI